MGLEMQYYQEIVQNCENMVQNGVLEHKRIYLFGHCSATEKVVELLAEKGYGVTAILDNNPKKHGKVYQGIPVVPAERILSENPDSVILCIATRFYEAMYAQLQKLGFTGEVKKLADYNTYAEYSLSGETIVRKEKRVTHGKTVVEELKKKYPGHFRVFCPFYALGDVYFCMCYLPYFLKIREKNAYVVCVVGNACAHVVRLFDDCPVEVMQQKELDAAIQAELFMQDENAFIAHQDRPYIVNLSRALYKKRIPLEKMYCCGVFGLSPETKPVLPKRWSEYADVSMIRQGQAVILSPYAKSVTALPGQVWEDIVSDYQKQGCQIFTNVAGEEKPLKGTIPISPAINEMKSVVERAGTFIGIRSGMCDVIRTAECRKIALYPDYNYSDTRWKAIDIYAIDTFENIEIKDGFVWKKN